MPNIIILKAVEPEAIEICLSRGVTCLVDNNMTFTPGSIFVEYSLRIMTPVTSESQVKLMQS